MKTIFWSIQSILSNPPYPIQPSYPIQSHSITSDQIIPSNRYSWPSEKGKLQIRRKCSALQNIYLPTSLTLRGDSRRSDISTSGNSKMRAITIWFSNTDTHEGLFSHPCFLFGSMQLMHSMRCVNIYSSKINVKKVILWKSTFLSTFLSRRTFLGFHSIFGALLEFTFLSGYTFLSSLFWVVALFWVLFLSKTDRRQMKKKIKLYNCLLDKKSTFTSKS